MEPGTEGFCTIEQALEEIRQGRMIVLVDDPQRENEGDIVVVAEKVTPEAINFMMRNACGLVCLAMSPAICDRLNLDPLPGHNLDASATPFTPYIDARTGITTGISAFDRARTVQVAIDERTTPADLVRGKGHVPGLRAREGGVLVRAGHTEGSVDLAWLAGLKEAAVICEVVKPDGHMARLPDLRAFCDQHRLKMCTIPCPSCRLIPPITPLQKRRCRPAISPDCTTWNRWECNCASKRVRWAWTAPTSGSA